MGNEMGNNNTSSLREEENTTEDAQGKAFAEPVRANNVKGEDHIVPATEIKDCQEKETWSASDDPNGAGDLRISDGREQEESEVNAPAESAKAEMETIEAAGEDGEIRTGPSLSKELQDPEKPKQENFEENLLGTSDHQLEKQASFRKEEEELSDSNFVTSPSHDSEPQESVDPKLDQHAFTEIHADQYLQDSLNSPRATEDHRGSNVTSHVKENGNELDFFVCDSLDRTVVPGMNQDVEEKNDNSLMKEMVSQQDDLQSLEKFEVTGNEDGNNIRDRTLDFSADIRQKGDGELTSEINSYGNNSMESQTEANLKANSLNGHADVYLPEDNYMVLTEDSEFISKESESEENEHVHHPNQFSEKSNRESEIEDEYASNDGSLIWTNCKDNERETLVATSLDPASNGFLQFEEEKVVDHGNHIDLGNENQEEASEEDCMESKGESTVVQRLEMLPEVSLIPYGISNEEEPRDCKIEEEELAQKQLGEEIEQKPDASRITINGTEETESGELLVSESLPVQLVTYLSSIPASLLQPQDYQQNTIMGSEDANAQVSNESALELKPENCGEFFVTTASNFDVTSLTVETVVSGIELATEKTKQEAPYNVREASDQIPRETNKSSAPAIQPIKQHGKVQASPLAKEGYEAQESMARLSTESNPDNLNIHAQMQKSPSFDLNLQVEARSEESDQTPLLYQDKTTIDSLSSQADNTLLTSLPYSDQYGKDSVNHREATSVEKKIISLERSASEKSRTPFLGFSKEDEEGHVPITPKSRENHAAAKKATKELWSSPTKDVGSTLTRGKGKHKRRTSLFGHCMCCATVIN